MDINPIIKKIGESQEIVEIKTTPARLFIFHSYLQFALRVRMKDGSWDDGADIAREMADNLAKAICHYVPEAKELIEMGWNPANDLTRLRFDLEFPEDS